ncbi:MAG: type IV secretory system conjugative DNA transfer family protein [Amphiplicatus sp.]
MHEDEDEGEIALAELLPRGFADHPAEAPQATARWHSLEELESSASGGDLAWSHGSLWLGRTPTLAAVPVAWSDDRHMVTVAASRAGKGTSAIVPVLCDYPGSVLVFDPKGENAAITAARRGFGAHDPDVSGMGQDVYVLDPFKASGVDEAYIAKFDPMAGMSSDDEKTRETARLIADALVVSADQRDAHWDESAKTFIEGLILHAATWSEYEGDRSLARVHDLLRDGDVAAVDRYREQARKSAEMTAETEVGRIEREILLKDAQTMTPFEALLETMLSNSAFDGAVSGAASGLKDLGDRERGSVLSTARRNLKFLDSKEMQACLREDDHTIDLRDLKRHPKGVSVFVVLPSRHMRTHARWMRIILNLAIARMEMDPSPPASGHRVLAVLDEFPTLGHMPILETAAGYMAGFGLKMWTILQDLNQLKRHYEHSWETFLGNAGVLQFFANADQTTLDYVSKRLGETEVLVRTENTSTTETETESDPSAADRADSSKKAGVFAVRGSQRSNSTSVARARTENASIAKAALLTADEMRRLFARETNLQLVLTPDKDPIVLRRTPYFQDEAFRGKFLNPKTRTVVSRVAKVSE